MVPHMVLIVALTVTALAAAVALIPGEREQWTMLMRDGHDRDALRVLEGRYRQGHRETDAVVHLHRLYMARADVESATRVLEDYVAGRANDAAALALLARHYGDVQNKAAEIGTLERLFALEPTQPTARRLLAHYRLEGEFAREEALLRRLSGIDRLADDDAERLGLMLASQGDLRGAREALLRFDASAGPGRYSGRLALFDVLVQTGDRATALAKGVSWLAGWRQAGLRQPAARLAATRLARMMLALDEAAAREAICEMQRQEFGAVGAACDVSLHEFIAEPDPATASTLLQAGPQHELSRRRRE